MYILLLWILKDKQVPCTNSRPGILASIADLTVVTRTPIN